MLNGRVPFTLVCVRHASWPPSPPRPLLKRRTNGIRTSFKLPGVNSESTIIMCAAQHYLTTPVACVVGPANTQHMQCACYAQKSVCLGSDVFGRCQRPPLCCSNFYRFRFDHMQQRAYTLHTPSVLRRSHILQ